MKTPGLINTAAAPAGLLRRTLATLLVGALLPLSSLAPQVADVDVTFATIAKAEQALWLDIRQERRVLDAGTTAGPRWLSIDERLRTAPKENDRSGPRFKLELLGVTSALTLDPTEVQTRSELHRRHARYLHLHGSLRIEDPAAAARNYYWLPLETRQRLGREVRRIAVIPRQFGANPWLLDVDLATSYPLYRAEYDAAGTLLAELEVTSFADLRVTGQMPSQWSQETLVTERFATLDAARSRFPAVTLHFPNPTELPPNFVLGEVKLVQDDLRPEPSIVATYTDGLDELFVIATLNAPRPALPLPSPGPHETYALFTFRDLNVGQLMFHDPVQQVRYLVIGKHAQAYLEPMAKALLSRAVGSN